MTDASTRHLRNPPRQARSAARVELLIDVAEEVFCDIGFDNATTNLVAARAGVPVGTLYRWFPDKSALAEALADRYLSQLVSLYEELLGSVEPDEHLGEFVHRVMERLVTETRHLRALPALLVSSMVPGGRSAAGQRLRAGLEGHIQGLIEVRVPGIPDDARDRTSEVCVTLVHLVIAAAAEVEDPEHANAMSNEYIDVALAYLEAKFPAADHPAWQDAEVTVKPVFPAPDRATRISAST